MSIATRRRIVVALVCAAATMFGSFGGCAEYYAQAGITSIDFCSIFNCDSSTFFNLCEPVPLLADCPNATDGGGG
ncbi:MAG: hypothetical protein JXO22_18250 [Phycisphaerae bacterium]|nr:hypothetical protein [Phycisphaerae bacterium]